MDKAAPQDEAPKTEDEGTDAAYEPPELTVIGSIEELTLEVGPAASVI